MYELLLETSDQRENDSREKLEVRSIFTVLSINFFFQIHAQLEQRFRRSSERWKRVYLRSETISFV